MIELALRLVALRHGIEIPRMLLDRAIGIALRLAAIAASC
jgi:hypothetical protein